MSTGPGTPPSEVPSGDPEPRPARDGARPLQGPREYPPARILVVDDNEDIVTVLRRILSMRGYETLEAYEGQEALRTAREQRPDVVLLDWMLPELDGLEVCRRLKADPETRGIMILLVTGRGSIANRVEGFNAGADDYIPKPFNHPELLARIRSALRIKRLNDELEERNRQLVESQTELVRQEKMATIGLLASGIAHEFNNIMAGISGYAQLARADPKYLEQLVDVALTQSGRAMELTQSLSTYNRRTGEDADCDVRSVFTGALCLVKKELEDRSLSIRSSFEDGLPHAAIPPAQLQEVILNLVINAIHATASGGTVAIEARKAGGGFLEIVVRDTGQGIPPEHLGRIFDPFFTTKGALGGGDEEGTGLGLSVCYNIVRGRGGTLQVESEVGRGSAFTVSLPVANAMPRGPRDPVSAGRPAPPGDERLRVLVVDDEGCIRRMVAEYLDGHDVVCCATGDEALAAYAAGPFDYVLLDLCMRESIHGLEVLHGILESDPNARVILASGRVPEDIDRRDLDQAWGHLLKPYNFEDLAALLGVPAATQ